MMQTYRQILEDSLRIAFDYLEGTGELGEAAAATRFLIDSIETMMQRGEWRTLLLSNRAIGAYKRRQTTRKFALVS